MEVIKVAERSISEGGGISVLVLYWKLWISVVDSVVLYFYREVAVYYMRKIRIYFHELIHKNLGCLILTS